MKTDTDTVHLQLKLSQDEKEKRRAEVRARMEQAAAAKKKKGFMTPARKKKLRNLIRTLAAEELKKEQARKAAERKRILEERTGTPKDLDGLNEAQLQQAVNEYHERIRKLEGEKYDLEYQTARKDFEVSSRHFLNVTLYVFLVSKVHFLCLLSFVFSFPMPLESSFPNIPTPFVNCYVLVTFTVCLSVCYLRLLSLFNLTRREEVSFSID